MMMKRVVLAVVMMVGCAGVAPADDGCGWMARGSDKVDCYQAQAAERERSREIDDTIKVWKSEIAADDRARMGRDQLDDQKEAEDRWGEQSRPPADTYQRQE